MVAKPTPIITREVPFCLYLKIFIPPLQAVVFCAKATIKNIFLKLGKYTRKEDNVVEEFCYYESYKKGAVLSVVCKAKAFSKVISEAVNPSKKERNTLLKFIKYSESFFDQATKEKTYEWDWLVNYKQENYSCVTSDDVKAVEDCKNPKLFFSVLGYSMLAFAVGYIKRNFNICPINIITDNESLKVVEALISSCFVRTGENDSNSILKFSLTEHSHNKFCESKGRIIIINAMNCQSKTIQKKIKSFIPELNDFLNQKSRKIYYPYECLPIFISKENLGVNFINIDATKLNAYEWENMYYVLHKLYEYPFYSELMLREDPVERLFVKKKKTYDVNLCKWFTLLYKESKKFFISSCTPQDMTLPKNYDKMMHLLWTGCYMSMIPYNKEGYSWYSEKDCFCLRKLVDKAFIPPNIIERNNQSNLDCNTPSFSEETQSAETDESNFIKVLRGICDSYVDKRPQAKSEVDSTAFLYNKNEFNAICFREEFFKTLVQKLSIDNYEWNKFRDNCLWNDLIESNNNAKDISIRVDGTPVKFLGLNKDKISSYLAEQSNQA